MSDFWRLRNLVALVQVRKERLEIALKKLEALAEVESSSFRVSKEQKRTLFHDFSTKLGCELSELLMSFNALKKALNASFGRNCLENPFVLEVSKLREEIEMLKKKANVLLDYRFL